MFDSSLEEAKFNHEEMSKAYEQLSYITDIIEFLYDDLVVGRVSSLDYVSGILKLMIAYEEAEKATKYF